MTMFKKDRTFIIAEAGINHNGSFNIAKKLIVAAKAVGADAVKFQAFKTGEFIIKEARKAAHVKGQKSFFELIKSWELKEQDYVKLAAFAKRQKMMFFASVFGPKSMKMLEKIRVPIYKIASMDLNNHPFLRAVAKTRKPVIISTGMGNLVEIRRAVKILESGRGEIGILHCVALYPPEAGEFHLEKIGILKKIFPRHTIGFSDHSLDILTPVAAAALGARIIEKHFTLDKKMAGPDQRSSADPKEFRKMVDQIRYLEKAITAPGSKFVAVPREQKMKSAFRRSIVTERAIKKGAVLHEKMLGFKRPGSGIAPSELRKIVGRKAKRDLAPNTIIKFSDLR
ncbi:MAG: N-acetylneuraminate synthase family protein [Candidatus Doudnabacteria bacterium]|nr:N-acetylneuraminate synthase family protein [Candidatus Doudnabacteria bacterium]